MPRIPNYERQTRTPGVPGVRMNVNPDTGLGDVARGVGQVAGILSQEAVKVAEDAKSARLMDAYSQLGNARIDIEQQIGQLHGKDALEQNIQQVARDQLKTKADEITGSLPADLQTRFRQLYQREDEGIHRSATEHFNRENQVYADQSYKGTIATAASQAAQKFTDPVEIDQAWKTADHAIANRAQNQGWAPDRISAERLAAAKEFHGGVLNQYLARNDGAGAQAYLASTVGGKSVLDSLGDTSGEFIHKAQVMSDAQQGATLAFQYANQAKDPQNPMQVDVAKALGALDADFEAKKIRADLYQPIRSQLLAHIKDTNDAAKQVVGQYASQAMQSFMAPGPGGQPRLSISAVPLTVRAWLTDPKNGKDAADVWEQLVRWDQSNQVQQRNLKQLPTEEQARTFLELHTEMMRHPEKYRAMTPEAFAGDWLRNDRLSLKDYNTVADDFAKINKAEDPQGIVSTEQMVVSEAGESGLLKPGKNQGVAQREGLLELQRRVEQESLRLQSETGKKPDPAALRDFTRKELQKVEVKRLFGLVTTTKPKIAAEVAGEEYQLPGAVQAAAPVPVKAVTPAPTGTPAGWIPYRNAKTGEIRYNAPGKAKGDWKEVR